MSLSMSLKSKSNPKLQSTHCANNNKGQRKDVDCTNCNQQWNESNESNNQNEYQLYQNDHFHHDPIIVCLVPVYSNHSKIESSNICFSRRPALTLTHFPYHNHNNNDNACYDKNWIGHDVIYLGQSENDDLDGPHDSKYLATISITDHYHQDKQKHDVNSTSSSSSSSSTNDNTHHYHNYKIILSIQNNDSEDNKSTIQNSQQVYINGLPYHKSPYLYKNKNITNTYEQHEQKEQQSVSIELHHGDLISLHHDNSNNTYQYKVCCINPNVYVDSKNNHYHHRVKEEEDDEQQHQQQQLEENIVAISQSTISSTTTEKEHQYLISTTHPLKLKGEEELKSSQKVRNNTPTHTYTSKPNPPLPPNPNPIQIQAQYNIIHEIKCPICLDILVETTSAYPCGHNFCYKCITEFIYNNNHNNNNNMSAIFTSFHNHHSNYHNGTKITNCPSCREGMHKLIRDTKYDDLIWNIICLNQVLFQNINKNNDNNNTYTTIDEFRSDLLCYFERRKNGKSIHELNHDEKECIFGRNYETILASSLSATTTSFTSSSNSKKKSKMTKRTIIELLSPPSSSSSSHSTRRVKRVSHGNHHGGSRRSRNNTISTNTATAAAASSSSLSAVHFRPSATEISALNLSSLDYNSSPPHNNNNSNNNNRSISQLEYQRSYDLTNFQNFFFGIPPPSPTITTTTSTRNRQQGEQHDGPGTEDDPIEID